MKWLLGTSTGRFNRRHHEFGHLFSGRYRALVVDSSGNGYLKTVCDYAPEPVSGPPPGSVALMLRAKTTVPLTWMTERLKMGSRGYLTWLLQRDKRSSDSKQLPSRLGCIPEVIGAGSLIRTFELRAHCEAAHCKFGNA